MAEMRYGLKLSQNATIDELRAVWRVAHEGGRHHPRCMAEPGPGGPPAGRAALIATRTVDTLRPRSALSDRLSTAACAPTRRNDVPTPNKARPARSHHIAWPKCRAAL